MTSTPVADGDRHGGLWFALADHAPTAVEPIELTGRALRRPALPAYAAEWRRAERGVRLLIYTQDGLGLGHLRRASSVAAEFLRAAPGGSVLTISDSPLGSLNRDLPNHDYLKLPSIVKAGPGDWRPLNLPMSIGELCELRSRLILEAATAFRPDVLLVDHMPHGAQGELVPTLDRLRNTSTHIVLGVRDIIDAPEVVQQRWRFEGAFDALSAYYDQVLVYGSSEVFDVAEAYGWPAALAKLVRYCGYVCTPAGSDRPERTRARRVGPVPGGRMIVAMAGGVWAYYISFIYPQFAVDPLVTIGMVLMVYLGGRGTLWGPVLGAFILVPAQKYLAYRLGASDLYLVGYSCVFLVVILLLPRGILPSLQDLLARVRERRRTRREPVIRREAAA